jgi:hypothetical protein
MENKKMLLISVMKKKSKKLKELELDQKDNIRTGQGYQLPLIKEWAGRRHS